ncbi:MAG: dienelactone hydrolase family protein [Anaerolineales bacterium]|nr:dienelactone hydrolase family protein [Anaerolineales bacterium]
MLKFFPTLFLGRPLLQAGKPLAEAKAAMILIHGRGANARAILGLYTVLPHPDMAYLAPEALDGSWYPYSFLSPTERNEPYLSEALQMIAALVAQVEEAGIPPERIILGGFSQGACLASEFVARHARRYGGLLVFSGGVIGPLGTPRNYPGSLESTPVFIGCSDVDEHIPLERVHETAEVFTQLGARVTKKIYPGMGHTVNKDEVDHAREIVKEVVTSFTEKIGKLSGLPLHGKAH